MEESKNQQELSMDQLDMVTGGGESEAEAYLQQLMNEKHLRRTEVLDNLTRDEYRHFYDLLLNRKQASPSSTPGS